MPEDGLQRVIAAGEPGELDDQFPILERDGLRGQAAAVEGDEGFVGFRLLRQVAVELERQLRVGPGDPVEQRLEGDEPGGGDDGHLRGGALARTGADRLELDLGKCDGAGRGEGEQGDAVFLVAGGEQLEGLFVEGPIGIGREMLQANVVVPAAVVDDQPRVTALEALGLDVGAELVGLAGDEGQALLAHAGLAGMGAVGLQEDGRLFARGAAGALIDHVAGIGWAPEFRERHLFGIKAAVDQQVLPFGHCRMHRQRQGRDTYQREDPFHLLLLTFCWLHRGLCRVQHVPDRRRQPPVSESRSGAETTG